MPRPSCAPAVGTLLVACVVLSCAPTPASASDRFWSVGRGDGSGTFSSQSNWTPDLSPFSNVPGPSDVAHFGMTASSVVVPKTYTVSFTTDPTNLRLVVEDDQVTFDLNGHFYQATSPIAVMLGTVSGRAGGLIVTDGLLGTPLDADIQIGSVAGSFGGLSVTTGGLVLGSPEVFVGVNGTGNLDITSGGDVIASNTTLGVNSGVTGTATITGGGSSLLAAGLVVGDSGHGVLNITSGGRVSNTFGDIGVVGSGEVTVSGPGSQWVNSEELLVGHSGTGTLSITDGGLVRSAEFASLGESSGAGVNAVTVDGANSQWIHTGPLDVGKRSPGTLTITGGARVESGSATIATSVGTDGSAVTVSGAESTWTVDGDLGVGNDGGANGGIGTLRIQLGGTVDVAGKTTLHQGDLLALEGGTLNTSEIDFLQGLGTFQWTSGTLRLVHYDGNLFVPNGGVFAPGVEDIFSSSVNVAGIYNQQAGATLEIDFIPVGGIARNDFVAVSDSAGLGGTLAINLLDGAVPNAATSYIIFDALSIGGSFANVANGQRLTTAGGLGSFLVSYGAGSPFDPTQIVLSSFIPNINGDFDHDGDVDGNDFLVWQRGGSPNPLSAGDLATWKSAFGTGSAAAATGAVPEPTALVAMLIGIACLPIRWREPVDLTRASASRLRTRR